VSKLRFGAGTEFWHPSGIALTVSHGSVIEHNRVTNMQDEEGGGINLVTGGDNRVEHNWITGNRGDGIVLFSDANLNRIEHNTITDGGGGVHLIGPASDNRIQHNAIARTQFAGIVVEPADFAPGAPTGNEIARNTLASTADGIILFEAEAAEVTRNSVTGAGTFGDPTSAGFGIILDGVSHSLVDRNSVFGGRGPAISVGAAPDENCGVREVDPAGNRLVLRHDGVSAPHRVLSQAHPLRVGLPCPGAHPCRPLDSPRRPRKPAL
jgi:parallel beta-helix repeat protein